jgi:hypothetical protein
MRDKKERKGMSLLPFSSFIYTSEICKVKDLMLGMREPTVS